MKRADPNLWLYCSLMAYLMAMPALGAVFILIHLARVPTPKGPRRGMRLKPRKRK